MRLPDDVRRQLQWLEEAAPHPDAQAAAVAFDADGTLWRGDIGEDLLRYLAAEDLLPRHRGRSGVYAEYERKVAHDPADAYAYAVAVMAEVEEAALEGWCQDFYARRFEGRLFPWVRPLFEHLQGRGHPVWIVSASPLWPVRAGAKALGVPPSQVIGVCCPVVEGRLTGKVEEPVPCGDGKVHWLRARGVRPHLAFGNGDLDLPMLSYAERAVVVAPHGEDNALCAAAAEKSWPILRC